MQINIKGELVSLEKPQVMGILNITPDSFYDGGFHKNEKQILNQVEKMLTESASFIDIGAYSSRPDANDVDVEEEQKRLLPFLKKSGKNSRKHFYQLILLEVMLLMLLLKKVPTSSTIFQAVNSMKKCFLLLLNLVFHIS